MKRKGGPEPWSSNASGGKRRLECATSEAAAPRVRACSWLRLITLISHHNPRSGPHIPNFAGRKRFSRSSCPWRGAGQLYVYHSATLCFNQPETAVNPRARPRVLSSFSSRPFLFGKPFWLLHNSLSRKCSTSHLSEVKFPRL